MVEIFEDVDLSTIPGDEADLLEVEGIHLHIFRAGDCQQGSPGGAQHRSGIVRNELSHPFRVDLLALDSRHIRVRLVQPPNRLGLLLLDARTEEPKETGHKPRKSRTDGPGLPLQGFPAGLARVGKQDRTVDAVQEGGHLRSVESANRMPDRNDRRRVTALDEPLHRCRGILTLLLEPGREVVTLGGTNPPLVEAQGSPPCVGQHRCEIATHAQRQLRMIAFAVERARPSDDQSGWMRASFLGKGEGAAEPDVADWNCHGRLVHHSPSSDGSSSGTDTARDAQYAPANTTQTPTMAIGATVSLLKTIPRTIATTGTM